MKSQIRLGLCLALGLSLYACSSEGEPIGPKTPPVPEERPAFTLDLEAEGALSELRGDFNLDFKVGSKGALKVNVKETKNTRPAASSTRRAGEMTTRPPHPSKDKGRASPGWTGGPPLRRISTGP